MQLQPGTCVLGPALAYETRDYQSGTRDRKSSATYLTKTGKYILKPTSAYATAGAL
jgi:hypothetical protein